MLIDQIKETQFWWEKRKVENLYAPLIENARDQPTRAELESSFSQDLAQLIEQRRLYYQARLIGRAQRLFLYVPEIGASAHWERGRNGHWFLTEQAFRELRREVREELAARRETLVGWFSPLSGLVGTLLGFILGQIAK